MIEKIHPSLEATSPGQGTPMAPGARPHFNWRAAAEAFRWRLKAEAVRKALAVNACRPNLRRNPAHVRHAKNLLANLRQEKRQRRAELNRLATARKVARI